MEKARVTIPQTVPLILFGVHAQVSFFFENTLSHGEPTPMCTIPHKSAVECTNDAVQSPQV